MDKMCMYECVIVMVTMGKSVGGVTKPERWLESRNHTVYQPHNASLYPINTSGSRPAGYPVLETRDPSRGDRPGVLARHLHQIMRQPCAKITVTVADEDSSSQRPREHLQRRAAPIETSLRGSTACPATMASAHAECAWQLI